MERQEVGVGQGKCGVRAKKEEPTDCNDGSRKAPSKPLCRGVKAGNAAREAVREVGGGEGLQMTSNVLRWRMLFVVRSAP